MARARLADVGGADVLAHDHRQAVLGDAPTLHGQEERVVETVGWRRAVLVDVELRPHDHPVANGYVAVLAPLALVDEHDPAVGVDAVELEPAQLHPTDSCRVQDLQDGAVTDPVSAPEVGLREDLPDVRRRHQVPREMATNSRHVQVGGRVGEQEVFAARPREEPTDGHQSGDLGAGGEPGAVPLAVLVHVFLIRFEERLGHVARFRDAVLGGPVDEEAQVVLPVFDRAR